MSENKFRKNFEANMLDGDDLSNCKNELVNAVEVFEYLNEYLESEIAEAEKEAVREYDKEIICCIETECVASGAIYKRLEVDEDQRKEALKKRGIE